MRKRLWILPIIAVALFSLTWFGYLKPKIESLARELIQQQNQEHFAIHYELEGFEFDLFPPRFELINLKVTGKNELNDLFTPANIKQISAELNPFKLLIGKLEINEIQIYRPQVKIFADPLLQKDTPPQEIPVAKLFDLLKKFPIRNFVIAQLQLEVESLEHQSTFRSPELNLGLKYSLDSINLEIESLNSGVAFLDLNEKLDFEASATLNRNQITINSANLANGESRIQAQGSIPNWKALTLHPEFNLLFESSLVLEKLNSILTDLTQQELDLSGKVQGQGRLSYQKDNLNLQIKSNYSDLSIIGMAIGNGGGLIDLQQSILNFKDWTIQHPAGNAKVDSLELNLNKSLNFVGGAVVPELDLQKLLVSLGLTTVPTWIDLSGKLNCQGQFTTPYNIQCSSEITGKSILIKAGMKDTDGKIAEVPLLNAAGTVTIDNKSVDYKADLKIENNTGKSNGRIGYKDGFNISFSTTELDLKHITYLVGLNLSGKANIEGLTAGDSSAATFNMQLNTKDFVLDGYKLGSFSSRLDYAKGQLQINEILGAYKKTQYLGDISLDLLASKIKGRISAPLVESQDVFEILNHLFEIPVSVSSLGKAEMDFEGPLNFWKLKFNLRALFNEVFIAGDRFDSLTLDVSANGKQIQLKQLDLKRNQSQITTSGTISSEQVINIVSQTDNLRLEESTLISKMNSNTFGKVLAKANIEGTIQNPQILVNASLVNSVFGEQELPDSSLQLTLNKSFLDTTFDLLGSKVKGQVFYPLQKNQKPLTIKIQSTQWKYGNLLGLITGAPVANDFDTSLTSELSLVSNSGDLFQSSGQLLISELYLQKANQKLKNDQLISVQFNNGIASIQNFKLIGGKDRIEISGQGFTADRLNIRVNAVSDLRYFHPILPFLDEINGETEVAANIRGKVSSIELFGSAQLNNVFVRLKGFPHPFERIRSDISFSQNRILVNSLRAQLAGGSLNGDGSFSFIGFKNFPANIRARIDGVSLHVPDKVKTQGYGDLVFSGNWFPYILSGTYRVQSGTVEKEFTEGSAGIGNIKQSIYLPKNLREETFEPVLLDLQVITEKPLYLKNSMIDGYAKGNLQVKGPPTNPILLGRVNIEKDTKLTIKDKIFEVQSGIVNFNDPQEVNPELFVTAQSRIAEYDISVLVQGASRNPNIRLTSVPPLAEQDIISLLALGVTSSQLDQNIQSKDQQTQTGFEIGAAIISNNALSRNLQDRLGVNVQFTSSYDSTKNIAVPKVTVSRKLTDRLNAAASRTLGEQTSYDVKLQYRINNNISAIGTWEDRDLEQGTNIISETNSKTNQSIFGLDLEFKREFK
ncbi:MAG: translocation/assembly module TamB domain-containing protein [Bdellovibrionia bacterium]